MARILTPLLAIVLLGVAGYFLFIAPASNRPTDPHDPPTQSASSGSGAQPTDLAAPSLKPTELRPIARVPVSGRVTTQDGEGVLGAEVHCQLRVGGAGETRFELFASATSTETGAFVFPPVPVGAYRFQVREPGFSTSEQLVTLAGGVDCPPLELILTPGASIEGVVYDALGEPLADAAIVALAERGGEEDSLQDRLLQLLELEEMKSSPGVHARSSTDGSYRLEGLGEQSYRIRVTAPGQAFEERRFVERGSTDVDFRLRLAGILAGTVTTREGAPIEGAELSIRPMSSSPDDFLEQIQLAALPPIGSTTSRTNGGFSFDFLGGEHPYLLTVEAPGFQTRVVRSIVISEAEKVEETILLERGLVIRGQAQTPGGTSLSGARCTLVEQTAPGSPVEPGASLELQAMTDDAGRFTFDTLPESQYILYVSHADYSTFVARDLEASAPESAPWIEAQLGIGATISGRVIAAGTEDPISGAVVSTPDPGTTQRSAISDADGVYVLRGVTVPRKRRVHVSAHKVGFEPASGRQVTVSEGAVQSDQNFLLRRNGSIRGIVLDPFDEPASGATVVAMRPMQNRGGFARVTEAVRSDSDGRFFLEQVPPGEGTFLVASHPQFVDGSSDPFTVEPEREVSGIVFRVKIGGEISGRVMDSESEPIAGALVGARQGPMNVTDPLLLPSNTLSDENGEFILRGLPAGEVALLASAAGYLGIEMTGLEIVEAKRTANVEIRMTTGAKVSGFVRDSLGDPIKGARVVAIDTSSGLRKFTDSTDSSGEFEFQQLGPYPIQLEASAKGHGKTRLEEQAVNQSGIVITLPSFGGIRGRVTRADGEPLETYNVSPRLFQENGRALPHVRARTFTSESFDFGGLVPGRYEIVIGSKGLTAAVITDVIVRAKRLTEIPAVTLDLGGTIAGVVYEESTGFALPEARLTVVGGAENFHHDGSTGSPRPSPTRDLIPVNSEGEFEITGLFYDTAVLRVEHAGLVTQEFEVNVGTRDLVIPMSPGADVEGQVIGDEGRPVSTSTVELVSARQEIILTAKTDAKGNYRFSGIPPGRYTLLAYGSRKYAENFELKNPPIIVDLIAGETLIKDLGANP